MHILLVEDNPGDIQLFQEALGTLPFAVEASIATTGEEALHLLHAASAGAAPIDVILLDLQLPGIHGFEVLAALQRDPTRRFIPVVVLSSTSNPQEVNRCYGLGANAYIVKPSTWDAYCRKMQAAVIFWQACQFRTLPE